MTVFTDYAITDSDQHFSEPGDCFTAYIDPKYKDRTLRLVDIPDGTVGIWGDEAVRVDVPMLDKVVRPGSLKELLRKIKQGEGDNSYEWIPIPDSYLQRDARLRVLKDQNVEATLMFPQLGLLAPGYLRDPEVLYASLWAHARFTEEQWGWADAPIFSVAAFSLADMDRSIELLEHLIARGCRAIQLPPGVARYGKAYGDPFFDPFWARVNEAGLLVCFHITDGGFNDERAARWGFDPKPTFWTQSAFQWAFMYGELPAQETIGSIIYDNLFGRFPDITVIMAETGTEWAPMFCRHLDKMRGMGRNGDWRGGPLTERPSEIFKRHIRMHPYWEDDIAPVVEELGAGVIVGGSDYPHAEGLAEPSELITHLEGLSPATQKAIMHDNLATLLPI